MKKRTLFGWSSGKDSAMALYELKQDQDMEVVSLLTTVTEGYDRISMHGVRRQLLEEQAKSIGLPLEQIIIPQNCSNEIYEQKMAETLDKFRNQEIEFAAFGDLFLEDIRRYREERMAQVGMKCLFPLWGIPTNELAMRFIDLGFKAIIACVDTKVLSEEFAGREYDRDLLKDLPPGVDPCAENGEFHTFAYDGPIFSSPIKVTRGEKTLRENRFCFCDILAN